MRRITDECLRQALALLEGNRDKLEALVRALLEHDTLGQDEILAVTGMGAPVGQDTTTEAPAGEGVAVDEPTPDPATVS